MSRNQKIIAIIVAILIVAVAGFWLSGCGLSGCAREKKEEVVKIGAILPLTGQLSVIGEPEKNAIILAQEKINSEGKFNNQKMEILIEDGKGNPKEAVTTASKLIDINKVKILIVSTSASVNAVIPVVKEKNAIMFAVTSQPDITDGHNIFRISPNTEQEVKLLINFAAKKNIKRISLIYPNNELGLLIRKYFTQNYQAVGSLEQTFEYTVGEKDFRPLILKIKPANYEWIAFLGYPNDTPLFIKRARELGLKSNFLTSMATTWPSTIIALSEMQESPIFPAPLFMLENQRGDNGELFVKAYREKFGKDPNYDAAFVYDNIMVLAESLRQSKKSRNSEIDAIRHVLKSLKEYAGVSGKIVFLPDGDIEAPLTLVSLKEGRVVPSE